jgi:4-amino-4-deoxy-L-arabinose transferase-like glycosyltransferase
MGGISGRRIFAAGLLCAVAILFTQTKGALVFLGVALYLVWVTKRQEENTHSAVS